MKRELLREFPELNERKTPMYYKMIFYRSYSELTLNIKEMEKKNEPLPILLWFYKKKERVE